MDEILYNVGQFARVLELGAVPEVWRENPVCGRGEVEVEVIAHVGGEDVVGAAPDKACVGGQVLEVLRGKEELAQGGVIVGVELQDGLHERSKAPGARRQAQVGGQEHVGRRGWAREDAPDEVAGLDDGLRAEGGDDVSGSSRKRRARRGDEDTLTHQVRAFEAEFEREGTAQGVSDDHVVVVGIEGLDEGIFEEPVGFDDVKRRRRGRRQAVCRQIGQHKTGCMGREVTGEGKPGDACRGDAVDHGVDGGFRVEAADMGHVDGVAMNVQKIHRKWVKDTADAKKKRGRKPRFL